MSELLETKSVSTKWWIGLLTPQTVVLIFAGFASLVVFWNTQKNHSSHLDIVDKELLLKADKADVKSVEDRVTRQYETNNKILERIISLEKQQEYQRGQQDSKKELQK